MVKIWFTHYGWKLLCKSSGSSLKKQLSVSKLFITSILVLISQLSSVYISGFWTVL